MPGKRHLLTDAEIKIIHSQLPDPVQFANAVEIEIRERCAKICIEAFNQGMLDWRSDGHRYNLGYAHGADECYLAMTGKTLIDD
jgi:hypothetical protein